MPSRLWTPSLLLIALLLTAASLTRAQDAAPASTSTPSAATPLAPDAPPANDASMPARGTTRRETLDGSLRLAGGIGLGTPAIAGRAGIAGEYWLSEILGIGLSGAILRQNTWLGDDSASESVALVGTLRGAAHGSYAYFSLGAGYAHVKHTFHQGLCFGSDCRDRVERYHGLVLSAALGWLFHPIDLMELGPMLRFDLLVDPRGNTPADLAVTLGFELGVAS